MNHPLFYYRVCGLSIASQLMLPGVLDIQALSDDPDVSISYGEVPLHLDQPKYVGPTWQVSESRFLFEVPGIARCLVNKGSNVTVDLNHTSTPDEASLFILGTGMGAIFHQRGELLLHGSAVALNGRAVILSGSTGAGKSTLAGALCNAGFQFLSDDISVIRFDSKGQPFVVSDGRQHKLWSDAVQHLSLMDRQRNSVRGRIQKFYVEPCRSTNADAALPVAAVFLLREVMPPDLPGTVQLSAVDAAPLLREQIYKSSLAKHMGRDASLFGQIASLIRYSAVCRLNRARGFDRLNENIEAIKLLLQNLEKTLG